MDRKLFFYLFAGYFVWGNTCFSQLNTRSNTTPTYQELVQEYKRLDNDYQELELYSMGASDTDFPIYLCVLNGANDSVATFNKAKSATTILINNAIHPGEPDGVNASLELIYDWLKQGGKSKNDPVIAIIPAYNVGGMLNRGTSSRANQNGPEAYGFRGNTQNLDLNRDFLKMDSPNAWTFISLYQALDPDVFVDNHVSNGSDYQYTLTLISSLKQRLNPSIRSLTYNQLLPDITKLLEKKGIDWAPYVDSKYEIPDSGIVAFNDLPRYAQGYASLNHAVSFTVETHMLKPFLDRVRCTYTFLCALIHWVSKHSVEIEKSKQLSKDASLQSKYYFFNYSSTENYDWIDFNGYEASFIPSTVTNGMRLFYNRDKPYTKKIKYFNDFMALDSIKIPKFYIVPKSETALLNRLKRHGVEFSLANHLDDQKVFGMKISDFKSGSKPYEGHFLHSNVKSEELVSCFKEDVSYVMISTNQNQRDLIIHYLEPRCEDSFFAWNFLDTYVQEKEFFSDYVFEEKAADVLKANPRLQDELNQKRSTDESFSKNPDAQLFFIYQNSSYFEPTYYLLPTLKVY
jgi:hypothetical protein